MTILEAHDAHDRIGVASAGAVTRFEIIDQHGRALVLRGLSEVMFSVQDGGRTVKMFCLSGRRHEDEALSSGDRENSPWPAATPGVAEDNLVPDGPE